MHRIVATAVLVIVAKSVADFQSKTGHDRDVPRVEQPVEIGTEQEPVADLVRSIIREGTNVRRFKGGQGVLVGDGARPTVRVENRDTKRALSEAGFNAHRPGRLTIGGRSTRSRPGW